MEPSLKKQVTPVYLSVPQLSRLIDLLSTRKFDNVSNATFKNYGFNESDSFLAVVTLRFLGLIDESNKATPLLDKLRFKGEMRKKEFKGIIEVSYKKLFDAVEKPYELPTDELINEFNVRYSESIKSDRVARAAVSAFLKLCEYAGLREETVVASKKSKPRNEKQDSDLKKGKDANILNFIQKIDNESNIEFRDNPIVKGKMKIIIPEEWYLKTTLDDELNDCWREVIKAAHKYAQKLNTTEKMTDESKLESS